MQAAGTRFPPLIFTPTLTLPLQGGGDLEEGEGVIRFEREGVAKTAPKTPDTLPNGIIPP